LAIAIAAMLSIASCGKPSSGATTASATSAASATDSASAADSNATWPIVEVDATTIRLDGKEVGTTKEIEDLGRLKKVDKLFDGLKDQKEAWKTRNEGTPMPGVAGLRVDPSVSGIVLKSVFQTIAFAGYPRISFQIAGSSAVHDLEAMVPRPPADPPIKPEDVPSVVHVEADDAHVGNLNLTWRTGDTITSTRTVATPEVGKAVCEDWKQDKHVHTQPADPSFDQAVVH
jgi:hypothetical protein